MTEFNLQEIELETFELVDITRTALKDGYVAADFLDAQLEEKDGGSCCSCCSCTSTSSCSSTS